MATTSSLLRQMSADYAPASEAHITSLSADLFWWMVHHLEVEGDLWDSCEERQAVALRGMEACFHRLHDECDLEWDEVLAIQAELASDLYLM